MARRKVPDPLSRRHLLEQALDPARALKIARAYGEEDRVIDEIAFLRKALAAQRAEGERGSQGKALAAPESSAAVEARERLAALRDGAVEAGDPFLLRQVAGALGEEPGAALWRRTAEAARAAGKERYAADAAGQADRLEG